MCVLLEGCDRAPQFTKIDCRSCVCVCVCVCVLLVVAAGWVLKPVSCCFFSPFVCLVEWSVGEVEARVRFVRVRFGEEAMADISNPRPIVNSKVLNNYMGRRVTTVVKVLTLEGGNVVGEMPDGATITVKQASQHVAAQSTFMEVIGVVESDRFLRAETCTSFGDNFDLPTYNELCQLSNGDNRDCFF